MATAIIRTVQDGQLDPDSAVVVQVKDGACPRSVCWTALLAIERCGALVVLEAVVLSTGEYQLAYARPDSWEERRVRRVGLMRG